jgi:hypothetical protein
VTIQPTGASAPRGSRVFRLAGQHARDGASLEQSSRVALADEVRQVRAEGDVEEGVGLRRLQRLHGRAGVDAAERRELLRHELDVRLRLLEELLEPAHGGLAVLVVRGRRGPSAWPELRRLLHQHRRLHVGRGAQAEGVAVALGPDEGVGQRLGGDVEALVLVGEVGDGEADVGQEAAGEKVDLLGVDEVAGVPDRVLRLAAVVPEHRLELPPERAAGRVDLLLRQLPALAVGFQEGGLGRVAVDLADPDRPALGAGGRARPAPRRRSRPGS